VQSGAVRVTDGSRDRLARVHALVEPGFRAASIAYGSDRTGNSVIRDAGDETC
jgi:hypothetical protein